MKTAFLVVLYNQEALSCSTIQKLLKSSLSFENIPLVIWNNGPKVLENTNTEALANKGFLVTIKETPTNIALSKIYNEFMQSIDADAYAILDHDSEVGEEYLLAAQSCEPTSIGVPVITSNGVVRSPQINGVFENRQYNNDDPAVALGSGLVIGKEIKSQYLSSYGEIFDEHYFLYGVDFTFFYRAKKLKLISKVKLLPGFEHSLSRLEKESDELAKFRRIERSYDFGMTVRYYPTKARIKRFIKYSIHFLLGRCRLDYFHVWKALLSGKHYRDN